MTQTQEMKGCCAQRKMQCRGVRRVQQRHPFLPRLFTHLVSLPQKKLLQGEWLSYFQYPGHCWSQYLAASHHCRILCVFGYLYCSTLVNP